MRHAVLRADRVKNALLIPAPLALATTSADGPLGMVRHDLRYLQAQSEAIAVAQAMGAQIDFVALMALLATAPDTMRSSMQHDVEQGRNPEIDAIAGPIVRGGLQHNIPSPTVDERVTMVWIRVNDSGNHEGS